MATKHTPGPFEADGTQVYDRDGYEIVDCRGVHLHRDHDGNKGHWASVPGSHRDVSDEEAAANAALFAAAPDLLAACETILFPLKQMPTPRLGEWNWPALAELARKAIAKATREAP